MANTLVIVESPAKAKTISRFLGKGYVVKASMGHVRDLPKSKLGVDVENNFTPSYITIRGKGKILKELRTAVQKADNVYLAADPDREGEAICWHLAESLGVPYEGSRIEFNEITKDAIRTAIKEPRDIDMSRVDAQQARRILDRLVGYNLSPLLWQKVKKGLSAGRVQSVALRLICERQREIDAFQPKEYWSITALLTKGTRKKDSFKAELITIKNKKIKIDNQAQAEEILAGLAGKDFIVHDVVKKQRRRMPAPPFTTSTLQQEASRKLGFTVRKTMSLAQQLYEGLNIGSQGEVGLITYIRTDSTRVAHEAQGATAEYIQQRYGKEYLPKTPPRYGKKKEGIQDAHEAIRPTSITREPESLKPYLKRDQYRLYKLIWERFLASQMNPAIMDTLTIDVQAGDHIFRATGSVVKFPGFMLIYIEGKDDGVDEKEKLLPEVAKGDELKLLKLTPGQHFTKPPGAYTEASLVKTLEEKGIGRPSTYAPTIDTIITRGYVISQKKRLIPTELGYIVSDLMVEHFPDIIDVEFTAKMEDELDKIEMGKALWVDVVDGFYSSFLPSLEAAKKEIKEVEIPEEVSDVLCEKCGKNMVIKLGRYGKFLACPGFPECRNTKPILKEVGVDCPLCGGKIVERRTRKGRLFYGCANYPQCTFTTWDEPINEKCPSCGAFLTRARRKGVDEVKCASETCDYERQDPKGD
jgi:DNA topoisomerase-1